MKTKSSLSERIIRLRKLKKLKQREVAEKLQISYGTYQRYEYNYHPSNANLEAISSFYGCSLAWLVTGEGEPFPDQGPSPKKDSPEYRKVFNGSSSDKDVGFNKDVPPSFQGSSYDLAAAVEKAVRVLGSGTSYAYALYLNITHFERAIIAESRLDNLEKKYESLEQSMKELRHQLNLKRDAREHSEITDHTADEESA